MKEEEKAKVFALSLISRYDKGTCLIILNSWINELEKPLFGIFKRSKKLRKYKKVKNIIETKY